MTRQNAVPAGNNVPTISALIPLWDLCNHANGTVRYLFLSQIPRIFFNDIILQTIAEHLQNGFWMLI